jgi:hypothetical protein
LSGEILSWVVTRDLKFSIYKEVLENKETLINGQVMMRSSHHDMIVTHQNKKSLSPFDNKKYILPDGIQTLAHGHYMITTPNA